MRQHQNKHVLEDQYLSPLQHAVLRAIRDDELSYSEVAGRLGLTVTEVEAEFAAALIALVSAADQRPPVGFCRTLRRWFRRWRR